MKLTGTVTELALLPACTIVDLSGGKRLALPFRWPQGKLGQQYAFEFTLGDLLPRQLMKAEAPVIIWGLGQLKNLKSE